jgi:hypothetical protein
MVTRQDTTMIQRALAALDRTSDVAFSYDRFSDTMLIFFDGKPQRSTNVPIDDPDDVIYVLWDRVSDEVVGFQIDHFIADFIYRHPDLAHILRDAELRGITREEAEATIRDAETRAANVGAVARYLEHLIALSVPSHALEHP